MVCVEHHGMHTPKKIILPLAPLFPYKESSPYLNRGESFWDDIITFEDNYRVRSYI